MSYLKPLINALNRGGCITPVSSDAPSLYSLSSPVFTLLCSIFSDFSDARIGGGDSFCDRLNCRFTVYILVIFALLITTKHYVGDPIGCWCPGELK